MSKSIKSRIMKLEEARQQRQDQQPETITKDGIEARIYYGKPGKVPGIVVWYDSLRFEPAEAVRAIGPQLPPDGNIFAFPRVLPLEQWVKQAKAWQEQTETTLH
jgi:hypothetical protein